MNYNTDSAAIDEQCFHVGSLYEPFRMLHDRRERRGKQYPLTLVLGFIVLAKLGGADTPYAIPMCLSGLRQLSPKKRVELEGRER